MRSLTESMVSQRIGKGGIQTAVNRWIEESLSRIAFEHREEQRRHHTYDEDMYQYELLSRGDEKALSLGKQMFEGQTTGNLSPEPLKNYLYLFIASITLACRFCIEAGLPSEDAFNISDLYIRQARSICRSLSC